MRQNDSEGGAIDRGSGIVAGGEGVATAWLGLVEDAERTETSKGVDFYRWEVFEPVFRLA